jgi:hypothetical protein
LKAASFAALRTVARVDARASARARGYFATLSQKVEFTVLQHVNEAGLVQRFRHRVDALLANTAFTGYIGPTIDSLGQS